MQLKSLQNLETSFQRLRLLTFAFVGLSSVIVLGALYFAFRIAREHSGQVYVLSGGEALQARATDGQQNRAAEARFHVARFHELFFSLDPDLKAIEHTMDKALHLSDISAKRQYEALRENGYLHEVVAASISQRVVVDSVQVQMHKYPYRAVFYGKQQITRPTSITFRRLISTCLLREVARTDSNPNGLLIEGWRVTHNDDLKTTKR